MKRMYRKVTGWVFLTLIVSFAFQGSLYRSIVLATPSEEDHPNARIQGWEELFSESFDDDITTKEGWTFGGMAESDRTWGRTDQRADTNINPIVYSAWPAANILYTSTITSYPSNLDNWMIYGPIDLTDKVVADIGFSLYADMNETPSENSDGLDDEIAFCISTVSNPTDVYSTTEQTECYVLESNTQEEWIDEFFDLSNYVGQSIYVSWYFYSDENDNSGYEGAFIDEISFWATDDPEADGLYDFDEDFVDWTNVKSISFDGVDLNSGDWQTTSNPTGKGWTVTEDQNDASLNPDSNASAMSGYEEGLKTWTIYGPVDLSNAVEADVEFSLRYNLVYQDDDDQTNDDWLGACASRSADPTSFDFEQCTWWSGSSESDVWDFGYMDLSPFAGEKVYLAWYTEINNDLPTTQQDMGAYVDEINVWIQDKNTKVPDDVDYEADGILLKNGSFSDGLTDWTPEGTVEATDNTARLSGDAAISQTISIDNKTTDVSVSFSYAISSTEIQQNEDLFCASLVDDQALVVDFGCWDAADVHRSAKDGQTWDTYNTTLSQKELESVAGKSVNLVLELLPDQQGSGEGETTVFVNDITIYATGRGDRRIDNTPKAKTKAKQRDPNEPNDTQEEATPAKCNSTVKGVFGDVAQSDWSNDLEIFKITNVPVGKLVLDVNAASLRPPSKADTYLTLYDADYEGLLAENDWGDETSDPYIVYNNTKANGTYYFQLDSSTGEGPNANYEIKVTCGGKVAPTKQETPLVGPSQPSSGSTSLKKAWTMILYLNAEDQNCKGDGGSEKDCWTTTYKESITGIEKFIGDKQAYMNVVVLLDGPNYNKVASDVTRYVVQPNGKYTDSVNRWTLGEKNLGDPSTFVEFVKWAISNYPAEHYYLSIDDHGNGIQGAGWDHTDANGKEIEDQITPAELRSALQQVTKNGQFKIDIFDYEACLMGMVENAYDIKDFVNYMAAFQPVSWTSVNYPEYFRDVKADDDAITVAKNVIQKYPITGEDTPYTYSLTDLSKVEEVRATIDTFANALQNADIAKVKTIRDESQAFNGEPAASNAKQGGSYIDLYDLADRLEKAGVATNEAGKVKTAVTSAVVSNKAVPKGQSNQTNNVVWDYSNYHGLSIYFPGELEDLDEYSNGYQMTTKGTWDSFLAKAFGSGTTTARRQNTVSLGVVRPIVDVESSGTSTLVYLPIITR